MLYPSAFFVWKSTLCDLRTACRSFSFLVLITVWTAVSLLLSWKIYYLKLPFCRSLIQNMLLIRECSSYISVYTIGPLWNTDISCQTPIWCMLRLPIPINFDVINPTTLMSLTDFMQQLYHFTQLKHRFLLKGSIFVRMLLSLANQKEAQILTPLIWCVNWKVPSIGSPQCTGQNS